MTMVMVMAMKLWVMTEEASTIVVVVASVVVVATVIIIMKMIVEVVRTQLEHLTTTRDR